MATRPKNSETVTIDLIDAFVTLESFGVSEAEPVSTKDFASELRVTPMEAYTALDALADAELVDAVGRGLDCEWWINVPDVTADNAESIARDALASVEPVVKTEPKKLTAKEQDYKERTEYNARLAESQDGLMSQAVTPAETPVIAADGTNVTVPVDPENDPQGARRELDASKGERLISEEVITLGPMRPLAESFTDKPKALPVIDGLDQFIDDETGDMVYESRIAKAGLWLEPAEIPERPTGVSRNTWDAAHDAVTQSARDWYLARAKAQEEEYKINNGAPAPF